MKCYAVNIPDYGDDKYNHEILDDIAVLTGGTSVDSRFLLKEFSPDVFGHCEHAIISEFETCIIDCKGDKSKIKSRVNNLRTHSKMEQDLNIKNVIKSRISRLEGKSAIIGIGGYTDAEKGENRDKIIDSLNSCKSALEHGILPGGGTPYIHGLKMLNNLTIAKSDNNQDFNAGIQLFTMSIKVNENKIRD